MDARTAANLAALIELVARLVRANLESIHLMRALLVAEDLVGLHAASVASAIDSAAQSEADPEAIEAAVQAVAQAEDASAREDGVASAWTNHRVEVYELVSSAVQLLGDLPARTGYLGELAEDPTLGFAA